jgi:hypothetical protein
MCENAAGLAMEIAGLVEEARRLSLRGSEATSAELDAYFEWKALVLEQIIVDPGPLDDPAAAQAALEGNWELRDRYALEMGIDVLDPGEAS